MKIIGVFISILLLFSRCSMQDSTHTIEMIDGVRYVYNHSPLWGDEPKIGLEFVQRIGTLEGNDENYILYRPSDVTIDAEGNIYVLDNGNRRIQKFNSYGRYMLTIGREGQGPGEFQFPGNTAIDNNGQLIVSDFGNMRVSFFSTSTGDFLSSFQTERTFSKMILLASGEYAVQYSYLSSLDKNCILNILNPSGTEIREIGQKEDFGHSMMNDGYNRAVFDRDGEGAIFLSYYCKNGIEKYNRDGSLLFRADRPLNFEVTFELEDIRLNDHTSKIPKLTEVTRDLAVDGEGRVWILTFNTFMKRDYTGSTDIDIETFKTALDLQIFDPDGIWLCNIPVPRYFPSIAIFDDRAFFIDSRFEMCVYEYKIVELQ